MTIVDLEQFIDKGKSITYIKAFVELYNWKNYGQVYEIHGIVELEKMCTCTSTAKHPRNLGAYRIIEISSILHSTHIVLRNQERIIFYVNNYIDQDEFNQLYVLDWPEKGVQNTDAVARKLT